MKINTENKFMFRIKGRILQSYLNRKNCLKAQTYNLTREKFKNSKLDISNFVVKE